MLTSWFHSLVDFLLLKAGFPKIWVFHFCSGRTYCLYLIWWQKGFSCSHLIFFKKFIYFERVRAEAGEWQRERERERESQAGSPLPAQSLTQDSISRTVRSWPGLKLSQTLNRLSHPGTPQPHLLWVLHVNLCWQKYILRFHPILSPIAFISLPDCKTIPTDHNLL